MVFYFTSNVVDPPVTLFMGKDKYENEDLIKYGWPEDVWFHVEDMSSAHVYLRLRKGETIQSVPTSVLNDCAQLVKANSISGNKKNNIEVIYTMWSNLQKTEGMDVGQVSFHNRKEVYTIKVEKRINEIVNRLNKTKVEKEPDLRGEREQRDRVERDQVKMKLKNLKLKEKEEEKEKARLAEERTYSSLMKSEKMTSNQEADEDSDDFM